MALSSPMDTDVHESIDVIEAHLSHRLNCETSLVEYVQSLLRRSEVMRAENRSLACCLVSTREKAARILDLHSLAAKRIRELSEELELSRNAQKMLSKERDELKARLAENDSASKAMETSIKVIGEALNASNHACLVSSEGEGRARIAQESADNFSRILFDFFRASSRIAVMQRSGSEPTGDKDKDIDGVCGHEDLQKRFEETVARASALERSVNRMRENEADYKRIIARLDAEVSQVRCERQVASSSDPVRMPSELVSLTPARIVSSQAVRSMNSTLGRSLSRANASSDLSAHSPKPQTLPPRVPPPPARTVSPSYNKSMAVTSTQTKTKNLTAMLHQLKKDGSTPPAGALDAGGGRGQTGTTAAKVPTTRVSNTSSATCTSGEPDPGPQNRLFPRTLSKSPLRRPNLSPQPIVRKPAQTGFRKVQSEH